MLNRKQVDGDGSVIDICKEAKITHAIAPEALFVTCECLAACVRILAALKVFVDPPDDSLRNRGVKFA